MHPALGRLFPPWKKSLSAPVVVGAKPATAMACIAHVNWKMTGTEIALSLAMIEAYADARVRTAVADERTKQLGRAHYRAVLWDEVKS